MFDKTKPMDLGDIFSNIFKLLKETFSRNIIIAAAFLIPAGIVMAYGFDAFFSAMMEMVRTASENRYEYTKPDFTFIFANIGIYFLTMIVFLLGYLGANIGITYVSWHSLNAERKSLGETFSKIFSVTFLRSIGQGLLLSLVVSGCYGIGIIIILIGAAANLVFLSVIGALVLVAGIVFMIYLIFRWYFAFTAIVSEDKKVVESFSKSSLLVNGNWWRVFAIIILFSIIVDFAISIISTPIAFIVMWDFISQYFKMIASGTFNENDPKIIFTMMESFGFGFGILIIISTILDALITPLFNVILYADLKIRKNDFADSISPENLTAGEPSFDQQ